LSILFLSMIFFMLIGVPISFSVGLCSIVYFIFNDIPLTLVVTKLFRSLDSFPLLAVPFFILAGEIMFRGKIAEKLLNLASNLVGSFKGGLAHINILVSMFFAGMTGSATADSSAVGTILIPSMIEEGYEKDYTVAVTATSSVIGVIIPPSIPIVIAAITAQVSVGALLLAGVIPGILLGLSLMIVSVFIAYRRNYIPHKRATLKEIFFSFIDAVPSLFTIIIIVGGIYSGIFTPTESAIVAVVYNFILAYFLYKQITIKDLPSIFIKSCLIGGSSLLLYANASLFSYIVSIEKIPDIIMGMILSVTADKIIILLFIDFILILIGTLIDTTPAIIIFMPILLPISNTLGLNPIHFALIMSLGLSIGLATPPVGMCLFVSSNIAGIKIGETVHALIPYILAMFIVLLLVTFVPIVSMYIPNLVFK